MAELSNLKHQLRARENAAWSRITWGLAEFCHQHNVGGTDRQTLNTSLRLTAGGLPQVVTMAELSNLKHQLRARENAAWSRITWGLARPVQLHELEVLQGRMIVRDAKASRVMSPWAC